MVLCLFAGQLDNLAEVLVIAEGYAVQEYMVGKQVNTARVNKHGAEEHWEKNVSLQSTVEYLEE